MFTSNNSRFTCFRYFQFITENYFNEENYQAQQFLWNSVLRSLFASFSRESAKYLHVETCEKFCTFLDGLQSLLKQSPTFSDIWYGKFPILLCLKSDFFHKNANISKNNQKKYFLEPLHEIGFYHCFFLFFFQKAYKASEVVAQMCSVKKVVSKISQNSQKRTSAKVSFLIIFY